MAKYQLSARDIKRTGVIIEDHVYLQKNGLVTTRPDPAFIAAQGVYEAIPITQKGFTQAWILTIERYRVIGVLGVVDNRTWRLDLNGHKIVPNVTKIIGLLTQHHPELVAIQVPSQFYHCAQLISRDMVIYQNDDAETMIYPESERRPELNQCDVVNAGNLWLKHGGSLQTNQYYPLVIDRTILGYVGKINGDIRFRKGHRKGSYMSSLLAMVAPHFSEV